MSDAFMGQSNEILSYLDSFNKKPKFLYRNVPLITNFSNIKELKKIKKLFTPGF